MAETKQVGVQVGGNAAGFNSAIMGAQRKLSTFKKAALGVTAAVGIAAGAMGAKSVSAAADFQGAMTESVAIMDNVSDSMRNDLAEAAREVGRTTKFSATEAAESIYYLASAGMDAAESEAYLADMAKFAQAGNFDMAKATELATDANSALGRQIDQMPALMDSLVQAESDANATTEQFSEALTNKAAPAMNRLGIGMNEGIALLEVFADAGLKGRRAGTIMARTLEGLEKRARKNSDVFKELGVQVYDQNGEMRSTIDIVKDLENAFEGMSTQERQAALEKMGFNDRAMQGLDLLLGNSEALEEYYKKQKQAGGKVDEVASKQMQHFNAQMGLMGDNINDIFIGIGNKMLPGLTDLLKNGLVPTTQELSKIVEESDSFIGFLDKASEQWLPGMNTEFKRLWNEGGGNFVGMLRQVGREQPAFQGALNAVAGGIEAVANWFDRVDWQHQKEQALNMAGDVGEEFSALGQTISDALGNLTGFEPKAGIDFKWDIETGLGEALEKEFGIGQQEAGTAAAGIRSAVFAFITGGTGSVFLGALAATVGVNLAAEPTVKFASDLKTAVMSNKSAEELKNQGVDFGNLPFDVWPVVKFGRNIRKAVQEEDTWQTLKEVDMPGKLDLIIDPVIGFSQKLAAAAKSSQPVEDFQQIDLGAIDVLIDPQIEFGQDLATAAKSTKPMKSLVDVGIEHPVKLTLGLAGAGAGIWWAGGKAAAAAKGAAGLVSTIVSTIPATLALGALAATATIGITILDKKITSEETEYDDFAGWAEKTFETEMPDSMEHTVNQIWLQAKQLSLKQIFQDISDAWETWENEGPPWSNINWNETFHPPDWAQDINWGEIPWMDIINPFQKDDWPDVISDWPGWDAVAKIGSLGKSAWKTYVGWPGWKTLDDWIFPEWGKLADIDNVNWKQFTKFEGWANLLESVTWPGWGELFPELASVDWQKWTTFTGWANYIEANWPGWKELFGINQIDWNKWTSFKGWANLVGDFDKWPGWDWANVGPLKLGDWVEIAWNKAAEKWPGWETVIGTVDPFNLRGKVKKVGKSAWKELVNWQGWEIAGIDQINWKQYTTFKGWKQYIDAKWQGWKQLFGIEEIDWASLTTFDGWQQLFKDVQWPGWQALFPKLSKVDWGKFASFDGWKEIFADVQWPGWANWIDPVGSWKDLIGWDNWKSIFPEWPGWNTFMNLTPKINFGIDVPDLPPWLQWIWNNARGAFGAAVNRIWGGGGNNNDNEQGEGHQSGTPWTGSGPRDQIAGFVHNQEAVIPSNVLRGGPGPILDFLGYSPGQGSLNQESGRIAGKLDKIEQNTSEVVEKLSAVVGGQGGKIQVDINGVVSLEDVLARVAEEWDDQRRAVGKV